MEEKTANFAFDVALDILSRVTSQQEACDSNHSRDTAGPVDGGTAMTLTLLYDSRGCGSYVGRPLDGRKYSAWMDSPEMTVLPPQCACMPHKCDCIFNALIDGVSKLPPHEAAREHKNFKSENKRVNTQCRFETIPSKNDHCYHVKNPVATIFFNQSSGERSGSQINEDRRETANRNTGEVTISDDPPGLVTSSDNDSSADLSGSDSESDNNPCYEKFINKTREQEEAEKKRKSEQEKEKQKREVEKRRQEQKRREEKIRKEEEEKKKIFDKERKAKEMKKREEERKRLEELIKKEKKQAEERKEQEKRKKILLEKQEKDNRHTELLTFLSEGSKALLDERVTNALMHYGKAMDWYDKYGAAYFDRFKEVDYVVVKYSMGDACVKIGTNKEIQHGMACFQDILQKHESVKFPLAFLGLGRAFHRQNKFEEALGQLRKGLTVVTRVTCGVHTWPGTQTVIEETRPGMLKKSIEDLMNMCRNPPAPDATCRYHQCSAHYKIQIYINDPDLKGFVRVRCFAKCKIEYHLDCWRKFKKERISSSDKDYLNVLCFTPNCEERISEINIFDHNGALSKELKGPEKEKPLRTKKVDRVKMKLSSQLKIAKKAERKARRREYKEKARQKKEAEAEPPQNEALEIIERLESEAGKENGAGCTDERGIPGPQHSPVLVLKKDMEDFAEHRFKTKKSKKRDKASKVTKVSLDEFVGREGEVYEDEDGVLHRTPEAAGLDPYASKVKYAAAVESSNPFVPPRSILSDVQMFESTYKAPPLRALRGDKTNAMTNSLMQFFAGMLREHGPMLVDDVIIQRELEEFPQVAQDLIQNAGGLGKFLKQSLEFALIDNVVCLMKDAVKANELAQAYKTPFKDRYTSAKLTPARSKPSITSQILDSSLGGFPNKLSVIQTDTSDSVQQEGDLFAGLNFKAKPTRLDQLDFIEDLETVAETKKPIPLNPHVPEFTSAISVPSFTPSPPLAVSDIGAAANQAAAGESQSVPAKKLLDDIDDDVSDRASSDGRLSESRSQTSLSGSGSFNVKVLFKNTVEPLARKNSQESVTDKVETMNKKPTRAFKAHFSASDMAAMDDLDSFSRGSSDFLDDIPLYDNTNLTRNQNHIQALKEFSHSLTPSTPEPEAAKVLPDVDFSAVSLHSSPASSVYSWPKPAAGERPLGAGDKSDMNDVRLDNDVGSGDAEPESLKKSRLKDWLPKSPDANAGENEAAGAVKNVAVDAVPEHEKLSGGILSDTAAWRHKKVDLVSLESYGGLIGSDDDEVDEAVDPVKPDLSVDGRAGDQDISPARTGPDCSPFGAGSRSATPDSRANRAVSPLTGLPRPSQSVEDNTVLARAATNVYGAIGSRTESPAHASVSSRSSSKTGTPLHTPSHNPEPLPVFPSAHDADDFPSVVAHDLTSLSKEPSFNFPMPKMDKASDTFFPANSSTLFPTTGFSDSDSGFASNPSAFGNNSTEFSTNPTSTLFPVEPSIWGSTNDIANDPSESQNTTDIDDEVEKHHKKIDDDFVKEMSLDAYNRLKDSETFKDNPDLLQQIERDVRSDVERDVRGGLECDVRQPKTHPSRKTRHAAVQYDRSLLTASKACNTDPYNPHSDQLIRANTLIHQKDVRYSELQDKYTCLKNSSGVEIKELRSRLDATEQECKGLRSETTKAVGERDSELRKWAQERRSLNDEVKSLKHQYRAAKSVESNVSAQYDRVSQELTTERETLVQERQHHEEERNKLRTQAGIQLARAQNSEVKFLKLQMNVGERILDSSLKDSEMRCVQLTQVLQSMIETNQPVPIHLQTAEEQWRQNVKIIRDMKQKHLREHEKQIEAVQEGTPLEILQELGLPKPPPVPQVSLPFQMPGRASGAVTSVTPPMMPFMNTGPLLFHMQNGSSSPLPGGATARANGSTGHGYPPGLVRASQTAGPQHRAKSSFEKIITQLSKVFPHCQKSEFMTHIQDVRAQRGGSLTGLTMAQIVQQVTERLLQAQQAAQQKHVPRVSNNWMAAASAGAGEEIFQEEEDPCLICFDELLPSNTTRLECGHRYHTECIRKWFLEQSTCPMCRNHTLLPDDYPSLI